MTTTTNKSEEIRNQIKMHRAMIGSLRTSLKEVEQNSHYGPVKGFYLETMKAITKPFANYNKNIEKYLANPDLYHLEKDILKLQNLCLQLLQNPNKLNTEKSIIKAILKLAKLEEKILANPAYISQSYKESMNVKETLEEYLNVKTFLGELQDMLKFHYISTDGIAKTSPETMEKIANPV